MCMTIRPKEEILLEMEKEPKHEQEEQEVGQQQQDSKESVRARLLAISQVQAPTTSSCEEVSSPLESVGISKGLKAVMPKLTPGGKDAADDEFRRKLMGMSYVEEKKVHQESGTEKKLGHQVVHLLREDLCCTLEIGNCSHLQVVSTMAGCHTT
ncbi:hypothetical protein BDL97_11G088900 [Sphagnum fallax]|nr:hypothetical protein BDL97_11G088900 [Sphagnum fallax]